jgi:hypothetical protein
MKLSGIFGAAMFAKCKAYYHVTDLQRTILDTLLYV